MHNIISAIILVCKTDADAGEIMIQQWAESPLTLDIIHEAMRTDPKVRARFLRSLVDLYRTAEAPAAPKTPEDKTPKRPVDPEKPWSHEIRDYLQGCKGEGRSAKTMQGLMAIPAGNHWDHAMAQARKLFPATRHGQGIYLSGQGPATLYHWGTKP